MKHDESKLDDFYKMIADLETAMFTTHRTDGLLVSRPMATQARAEGADLWFVTSKDAPKLAEIRNDANVNLSYFKDRTREWISVSGTARISTDRAKIKELYRPDWRAWFGDEGGATNGTADDPRIVLIAVDIKLAIYMHVDKPQPVVLFEVMKGILTGKKLDFPDPQSLTAEDMRRA